jgi:hypothetical protein
VAADHGHPRDAEASSGQGLPGDPLRDARLASILQNALPPRVNHQTEERGDYEDWTSWGIYHPANGHTTWTTEVMPTTTVEGLYRGEVARYTG